MVQTSFSLSYFGQSSQGLVRHNNEDFWAVQETLFALADGMGGHNAGEVAAQMAVSIFLEKVAPFNGHTKEQAVEACREALLQTNAEVHKASLERLEWKGMGTTLTALFFCESLVAITHVGDSRAYRFRDGNFKQLTVDHTVFNRMKGAKEAAALKHVLTRAIGTQPKVKPQIQTFPVLPHDRYMLCSDGLTAHLSDREIAKFLQMDLSVEEVAERLVCEADQRGGSDNTTVITIEVGA